MCWNRTWSMVSILLSMSMNSRRSTFSARSSPRSRSVGTLTWPMSSKQLKMYFLKTHFSWVTSELTTSTQPDFWAFFKFVFHHKKANSSSIEFEAIISCRVRCIVAGLASVNNLRRLQLILEGVSTKLSLESKCH